MAARGSGQSPAMPAELIVVAHSEAELRVRNGHLHSAAASISSMQGVLADRKAAVHPLFGATEERVRAVARQSPWALPDLATYYRIEVPDGHDDVAAALNEQDLVSGAYVKPAAARDEQVDSATPALETVLAATTTDFTAQQTYLNDAPVGVGARTAWSQPGGQGQGTTVIVIAGAWRLGHEDLTGNGGMIGSGTAIDAVSYRNHGTALLGVVRADANTFGTTGIAPQCTTREVATFGLGTAAAIKFAADQLTAGGIILIGWQRPGPGSTGLGSAGFIPLEWWPDDFAAIQFATSKGLIVVEPAGNGSVSLDDPIYNTPAPGFPTTWANPFDRAKADCGAVLVGAGAPPTGTHGRDHGPDRSRLTFSNYGSSLDAQGWGAEVTTLGYGDLQGGAVEDNWYTNVFGGTSAAAAMVAGTLATLQGIQLGGAKRPPLTAVDARRLLRNPGNSAQQASASEPVDGHQIGLQPDLHNLVNLLSASKNESKDGKDSKDATKENKDTKDGKDAKDKESKDSKDNKDNPDTKRTKDQQDKIKEHGKETLAIEKFSAEKHNIEQPPVAPQTPSGILAADLTSAPLLAGEPARSEPLTSDEPVQHFISPDRRPDLSVSPLLGEADFAGCNLAELTAELRPPGDRVAAMSGS